MKVVSRAWIQPLNVILTDDSNTPSVYTFSNNFIPGFNTRKLKLTEQQANALNNFYSNNIGKSKMWTLFVNKNKKYKKGDNKGKIKTKNGDFKLWLLGPEKFAYSKLFIGIMLKSFAYTVKDTLSGTDFIDQSFKILELYNVNPEKVIAYVDSIASDRELDVDANVINSVKAQINQRLTNKNNSSLIIDEKKTEEGIENVKESQMLSSFNDDIKHKETKRSSAFTEHGDSQKQESETEILNHNLQRLISAINDLKQQMVYLTQVTNNLKNENSKFESDLSTFGRAMSNEFQQLSRTNTDLLLAMDEIGKKIRNIDNELVGINASYGHQRGGY